MRALLLAELFFGDRSGHLPPPGNLEHGHHRPRTRSRKACRHTPVVPDGAVHFGPEVRRETRSRLTDSEKGLSNGLNKGKKGEQQGADLGGQEPMVVLHGPRQLETFVVANAKQNALLPHKHGSTSSIGIRYNHRQDLGRSQRGA